MVVVVLAKISDVAFTADVVGISRDNRIIVIPEKINGCSENYIFGLLLSELMSRCTMQIE